MKLKEYTPEQIADAEKLCQLMQNIPESRRQILTVSMIAYMSGVEAGIALERDVKQINAFLPKESIFNPAVKLQI